MRVVFCVNVSKAFGLSPSMSITFTTECPWCFYPQGTVFLWLLNDFPLTEAQHPFVVFMSVTNGLMDCLTSELHCPGHPLWITVAPFHPVKPSPPGLRAFFMFVTWLLKCPILFMWCVCFIWLLVMYGFSCQGEAVAELFTGQYADLSGSHSLPSGGPIYETTPDASVPGCT